MNNSDQAMERSMGLFGATAVGVGAIVGGGILALAGVAYATTGVSAVLAFVLNGVIALITAMSFAEMSTAFPQSGGVYTYAKKVLSVQTAFSIGWMIWFASIVASVLYALGFAYYALQIGHDFILWLFPDCPDWVMGRFTTRVVAISALGYYCFSLIRRQAGGGQYASIGKVIVFAILIVSGFVALAGQSLDMITTRLTPFFSHGSHGLFQAMGYTFITLQGFDLIAAGAGEIKNPVKTIPRSMFISLMLALMIYLPLLVIIPTVGMGPGQTIAEVSASNPEIIIAIGVRNYMGTAGYWLVMIVAVLSMLSALHANLFASSRIAYAMALDRTLPARMGEIDPRRGTPAVAVLVSAITVMLIIVVIPNLAAAGAASSLIFLIIFSLAHGIAILTRLRGGVKEDYFKTPLFPLIPILGFAACFSLAVFQGVMVPATSVITLVWMAIGGACYYVLFARRARIMDASMEALNPQIARLRGHQPLVLAPIANPANADSLVAVAHALTPPAIGRIMLLTVVAPPVPGNPNPPPRPLVNAQAVLGEALTASFSRGMAVEALTTIAPEPWAEITRVAKIHGCESLVVGFTDLTDKEMIAKLESVISRLTCDVVVLRAPPNWRLHSARKIIVPVGGKSRHDELRARLLGSLCRTGSREITFIQVVPENITDSICSKFKQELTEFARDETGANPAVEIIRHAHPEEALIAQTLQSDLIILGVQQLGRHRKGFGRIAMRIVKETPCGVIMINQGDG